MSVTQKDFQAIAKIIKDRQEREQDKSYYLMASDIGYYFAAENPRFDREKFLSTCGMNEAEK